MCQMTIWSRNHECMNSLPGYVMGARYGGSFAADYAYISSAVTLTSGKYGRGR